MSKMMTVIKREYLEVVQKKSFLIGIIITPLLMGVWIFVPTLLMRNTESPTQQYTLVDFDNGSIADSIRSELLTLQTSDSAPQFSFGAVEKFSPDDEVNWSRRQEELNTEVQNGDIDGVLILYPEIVQAESLVVISKKFDFKVLRRAERKITKLLTAERLKLANINLPSDSLARLTHGVDIGVLSPAGKSKDFGSMFFGMMLYAMAMFMLIFNYGQVLMRSVIEEKTTRIMEVMVSSVSPFQLMMGKIVGLGAAALTQVAIWGALGAAMKLYLGSGAAGMDASMLDSMDSLFNPIALTFFTLFLIVGFFLYSTFFAAIGSMVNTDKEAQNYMMPIVMMFVLPFMLAGSFTSTYEAGWAVALSLIPFTAPSIMVMRLTLAAPDTFSLADPIILQAIISLVIMVVFTVFMSWVTARIFRIGVLMYGKRPTLPEIVRWVRRA